MPPPETTNLIYQILERFGFPVLVSVGLGWFIWTIGRGIVTELGRLTRAVALLVLSMQFFPQGHEQAEEIYEESLDAARSRKEKLESEISRRKKHP